MTRAALRDRLRAFDHLWLGIAVGVLLLMLLTIAAAPQWAEALLAPTWERPEDSEERKQWVLAYTGIVTLITVGEALLMLVVVIWGQRWTARKLGLVCPSCGVALLRSRRAVLGAGKCSGCQAHIVADAPVPLSGEPLPTRDEFLKRLAAYKEAYQRTGQWCVPAVLLCFLPGFIMCWPLTVLEPAYRSAGLDWLAIMVFFASMICPVLICMYYVNRWESRLRQENGVVCRWCDYSLTRPKDKTAETGRCAACGQPAWSDSADTVDRAPVREPQPS